MLKNPWKQIWQVLNTEISWPEATQAGVDSSKAVLDLAKTLNENRNAQELAPLIGKISSLLDILTGPLAQIAGSTLPFIPLATGLLRFLVDKTQKEPTLAESVVLASQAAYLESLRIFLRNQEQKNKLEKILDNPASINISQKLNRFGEVLKLHYTSFEETSFEVDEQEAKKALLCFHNSKLAKVYNSLLSERLQDAGLSSMDATTLTERVSRNTHRYLKESFSAARDSVKTLVGNYGDGWIEDLNTHESIDDYLESIAANPTDKVFAEIFAFEDIYIPLQAATVDQDGKINSDQPYILDDWAKACLEDTAQSQNILFVQAGPGRGKSVFCRMFADWVRREMHPIWTPILIRLRNIGTFEENIEDTLKAIIGRNFTKSKDWLTNRNTRFLLILDGFDELILEGRTSKGLRDFLTKLGRFQKSCANNSEQGHRVLITGRTLSLQSISTDLPSNLNRVAILPMTQKQQAQWLIRWERLVGTAKANAYQQFLRDKQCPDQVKELAQEPLLLYLLGAMHRDNEIGLRLFTTANPTHAKILIYQKSLDWVLTKQRPEWLNRDLTDIETEGLRRILTEAGLSVIQIGGEAAPMQMIEDRLANNRDALELIKLARERLQTDALRNALAAFYIRPAKDKRGSVEFIHKSFSEFLCAQRLYEICNSWTLFEANSEDHSLQSSKNWEIYDALGFGRLTVEIVNYWRTLIDAHKDFKIEILFKQLEKFYELWCKGNFIDLLPQRTLPQRKSEQLKLYNIHLGQRQVDNYVGLNIIILLLELHCHIQSSDSIKNLHFFPCGQPNTAKFESSKLITIIGYSQCLGTTAFRDIVGQFFHYADLQSADLGSVNLQNANLSNANLQNANLSNTNLSNANLSNANLSNAILCHANLSDANLSDANLGDANLSDAILCDVKLRDANLCSANLCGADLLNANLYGANLCGANLHSANLNGAFLDSANLSGANLCDTNFIAASLRKEQAEQAILCRTKLPDHITFLDPDRDCQ